jgi:hypothetical protein
VRQFDIRIRLESPLEPGEVGVVKALFGLGILGSVLFCAVAAQSGVPATLEATLERAIAAHGGSALEGMKTYAEDAAVNATVLGINVYNQRFKTTVDFGQARGRIEISSNGKMQTIYQVTPQGARLWTPKDGVKDVPPPAKPGAPFTFSMPIKSGLLGLLAVGKVADERLSFEATLELRGVKGAGIRREGKEYQVTYLFNTSGLLALERTILTNEKGEKTDFTLVYNAYKTVNGVKVPVTAQIFSPQIPEVANAQMTLTSVSVNPTITADAFKLP